MEIVSFGLLLADSVTSAVLPDVTPLTSNSMLSIVKVLTVHAANGAVEKPFVLLLLKPFKIPLPTFHVPLEFTLRDSGTLSIVDLVLL